VLYVPDLAAYLRISAKAVRHRVTRGQLPAPMKLGKELAWTRDLMLDWLRNGDRSARPVDAKITLRPYARDPSRWQLDIRLIDPCTPARELRRRIVAPAGMDPERARQWGEHQVPALLRALTEDAGEHAAEPSPPRAARMPRPSPSTSAMTLAELYARRFEPEHVLLQKPATRDYYAAMWRNHIEPLLGDVPLALLDEDRLSAFRAALRRRMAANTANVVLSKIGTMLRFARKIGALEVVPPVERLPSPHRRPKAVYSEDAIAALVAASRRRGTDAHVVCLLALDAGLRVSEICALEWDDIDLREGSLTIQHNNYRGRKQTPKGKIGKLALTTALRDALLEHRREGPRGPLVLHRRTGDAWSAHTPRSITYMLNQLQRDTGLKISGPHLLRHTALTRLANLGASVYVVQAVARHARLQTTQDYLHTQQLGLAREAASLLDRAHRADPGNAPATPAPARPTPP
jgi:integrase/recombinase XerC